jgi:hypothetical protein
VCDLQVCICYLILNELYPQSVQNYLSAVLLLDTCNCVVHSKENAPYNFRNTFLDSANNFGLILCIQNGEFHNYLLYPLISRKV